MDYPWAVPGAKVVCIANATGVINDLGFPPFKKGERYTISELSFDDRYGLFLAFVELDRLHTGHVSGFRPLITKTQEQDVEMFRKIAQGDEVPA